MRHAAFLVTLVSLGCGSDPAGGETTLGSASEVGEAESEDGEAATGETEGGESETTGGGDGVYVDGLTITALRTNQGAAVPIWVDGANVGGSDRAVALQVGRPTMFRVSYTVASDWTPREVRAVLHLVDSEAGDTPLEVTAMVTGDSDLGEFENTLGWVLTAEQAASGTSAYVEIFEVDADAEPPAVPARAPAEGTSIIGFQGDPAVLDVVLVPVNHFGTGCEALTVLADGTEDAVRDRLMARYPLQTVNVTTGPAMDVTGDITAALNAVNLRKMSDGADASVYYVALIAPCDDPGTTTCTTNTGARRTAALMPTDPTSTDIDMDFCNTLAFGGVPVNCPANPGSGTDPTYPNEDGLIEDWGFDIITSQLYNPATTTASTTQCGPGWTSQHNWKRLFGIFPVVG